MFTFVSIPWLEKAHHQQPGNTVYRANLGVACLRADRLAEARTIM